MFHRHLFGPMPLVGRPMGFGHGAVEGHEVRAEANDSAGERAGAQAFQFGLQVVDGHALTQDFGPQIGDLLGVGVRAVDAPEVDVGSHFATTPFSAA